MRPVASSSSSFLVRKAFVSWAAGLRTMPRRSGSPSTVAAQCILVLMGKQQKKVGKRQMLEELELEAPDDRTKGERGSPPLRIAHPTPQSVKKVLHERRVLLERKEKREDMIEEKTWAAAEKFRNAQVKRKMMEEKSDTPQRPRDRLSDDLVFGATLEAKPSNPRICECWDALDECKTIASCGEHCILRKVHT